MSSKSKKNTPPPAHPVAPGASTAAQSGAHAPTDIEHAEPTAKDFQDAEELLKVPRGRSKATYALLIFLLIFLTAVFVVLDYLPNRGGAGRSVVEMSWERPGVGKVEYMTRDWWREKRTLGLTIDFMRSGGSNLEDADVASFLIMDTLAQDAGLRVTDNELKSQLISIASAVGGKSAYEARVRNLRGIGVAEFESTLRRMMRVERLTALMGLVAAQPKATAIQELWNERRSETAYEYVLVAAADYRDAALAEAPDDATLEAWLAEQPEADRRKYEGPARTRAELVGVLLPVGGTAQADALLAAYPEAADVDAEARATKYYGDYAYVRFPAPEGSTDVIYRAYEEVAEQAAAEARIFEAMRAFKADLDARIAAGETIDLKAEAERLGLVFDAPEGGLTQLEWRERDGLSGTYAAGQIARLAAGALSSGVIVEKGGFGVARAIEQMPPSVPAFAEIRERVLSDWADQRAKELATQELADLRALMLPAPEVPEVAEGEEPVEPEAPATTVTAERFAELAGQAGLEVGRRDWLDSGAPVDADPLSATPAHAILRTRASFARLEVDGVSEPLASADGKHVLLARLAGKRDVPLERMQPKDFTAILSDARQRTEFDWLLGGNPFDFEKVRERYNVRITSEEEEAAEKAKEAGTAPPAPAE